MKLAELKKNIEEYQYLEDTNIIDVSIASIVATRLMLGDPIWLVIIGASSGGKSQILRPLSLTDSKFLHRIDDLTENTFLSGIRLAKEQGSPSLLHRIGKKGMIVMSDLTVLFSKAAESRATILSQFRMIYDGEMTKFSGTSSAPITWKGYLGIIAGSTPSIYHHFEEVADMGERFIYYRMKDYDGEKATRIAMSRPLYGKDLDDKLAELYADYIKDVVKAYDDKPINLPEDIQERIIQVAQFAERVRTPVTTDWKGDTITRIPVSAMPMRVALQLTSIAKALYCVRSYEEMTLSEKDLEIIDWCGYSLANEEKRAVLNVLARINYGVYIKGQTIADQIGLSTGVVNNILQNLASVGILNRFGDNSSLTWRISRESDWKTVRRINKIDTIEEYHEREITSDEDEEGAKEKGLLEFGKDTF